MVDAATEFLLDDLQDLLRYHSHIITDNKRKIENLERDLRWFNAFLRDTVKKRRNDAIIKEMVSKIQDVVDEVEDIIDVFVTKAALKKRPGSSSFKRWQNLVNLHPIGEKVEEIREELERRGRDLGILANEDRHELPRPPRRKKVVGFADVREDLVQRLTRETDYFDIIPLIGMFGLGKTTLAWKIFNDPQIVYKFPTRIWLPISQQFTYKEIFLDILTKVTTINDNIRGKEDSELAHLVAAHLERGSFLIVMDDVCETTIWDRLCTALPHHDNTKSKVLITSRFERVGNYVSGQRPPYRLRLFTFEESWELFLLEALGKLDCPSSLEVAGRKIAKNCDGLPLAIVAIGSILATRYLDLDTIATRRLWEKVSKHELSHLSEMDLGNRMQRSVCLSYDKLPYHLRICFLYFGLFPKGYEIPVSKLIRMWIGEGFIRQEPYEETAEKYLEDLININLVKREKVVPNGKVKTCRIHDTLHDFCHIEAANEHFLQEVKYNWADRQFAHSTSDLAKCRRLSLHSRCLDFLSRPFGPRVRSFVCFSKDKYDLSAQTSKNISGALRLLRVLDVLPFKFTKIDSDIYNLFHLRYIAFSSELSVLPSKFNQLWNLQTLIVNTTCRTLEVDIWKMNQLRHFKTNASATLPKSTKSGKENAGLQTLSLISVESCTEELSNWAPNLKKLGILGQLSLLFDGSNGSFSSLGKMRELGKLKLINDTYPKTQREGALGFLPRHDQFPPGLTSLTLCATFLSWEHMSALGLLKKLEVLKLKDNAFSGSTWEAADGGFQCLDLLHIENTDLDVWNASSHHYPKLRSLVLKNCANLRGIPAALADIPSLQNMELYNCISAAESAKGISDAKKKTQVEGSAFMLSINPPIE